MTSLEPWGHEGEKPTSHNQMNKDKADTPEGSLAEKVATEHTKQIVERLKDVDQPRKDEDDERKKDEGKR